MKKNNIVITSKYLKEHSNHIFVFGDNLIHKGKGGAAIFRDYPNSLGFITKKYPNNLDDSFYRPEEYKPIFWQCVNELVITIRFNPDKIFLVFKLGAGLANKYHIWEEIIYSNLPNELFMFDNVILFKRK